MEHRGYTGSVEYDAAEGFFYGRVLDVRDSITYEADCEERLEAAFRDAVDEYLDQCWACETEPEPPPSRADAEARKAVSPHGAERKRAPPLLGAPLCRASTVVAQDCARLPASTLPAYPLSGLPPRLSTRSTVPVPRL